MTKNTKVVVKLLTIVAIIAIVSCLVLVGCDKLKDAGKPAAEEGAKSVTILLQNGNGYSSYTAKTSAEYVQDLLVELKNAGVFAYEFHNTEYGAFMDVLGTMHPNSDNYEYIMFYHDINDAELIYPGYDVEYDGKTYSSASLGVSSFPVRDGATYLFKV